jgi:acyl-CoA synthetase (AMP-forming)/AMP-acid ligase II
MIIADLVRRSCRSYSSNVAVTDHTGSLSYGDVWDRSVRLVNALRSLGVAPGDRVATLGRERRHDTGGDDRPRGRGLRENRAAHDSWMHVTADHLAMLPRLRESDVYLAAAPLTHGASTVLYGLLARGARTVIMPSFDAGEALRLIERERCTLTFLVPTMLQMLVAHPEIHTRDLSSLRAVLYAGAPISVATARAAHAALGDVLFQAYGQSECLPVTVLTPEDHARGVRENAALLRSVGRPCFSSSVRVVDAAGRDVGVGQIGEIEIHARGRMREIFRDPELTRARLTTDGYVRSGDKGYLDADGYLFTVGRIDDMIISGGFNIWPAEIENVLAEHPAVEEVLVLGVAHAKWGQTPHAVVTVRRGATTSEQELVDYCRSRLGSVKKPTEVVLRSEPLPRNAVGKISRRDVRQLYWPEPDCHPAPGRE